MGLLVKLNFFFHYKLYNALYLSFPSKCQLLCVFIMMFMGFYSICAVLSLLSQLTCQMFYGYFFLGFLGTVLH